jgi:DNA-binding MarR family transcriptional regulator
VQAFARFVPGYARFNHARSGPCGVSYPRLRLLGALHTMGPMVMSSLSTELGVTARNITALVDGLEGEKLVSRRPHPTDRRATMIALTARGERTCAEFWAERMSAMGEIFDELTDGDRSSLLRLMEKLMGSLKRRGFLDDAVSILTRAAEVEADAPAATTASAAEKPAAKVRVRRTA